MISSNSEKAVSTPLKEYLDYYSATSKPGYAVLVTGPWGIGKTHQVKAALETQDTYYVSLFGRESVSAIRAGIFAAMYPDTAKINEIAKDVTEVKGGFLGLASKWLDEHISRQVKTDGIIVLDDLERCKIEIDDLLGVINHYIEHQNCKVIVIAHDKEASKGLSKRKEKLFGQVIKAKPQLEAAYETFKFALGECAKAFVNEHSSLILRTFKETGCESLRILRHIVEDIGRLRSVLKPKYLQKSEAMAELLGVFVTFNTYIRSGKLKNKDLRGRRTAGLQHAAAALSGSGKSGKKIPEESRLIQLDKKHPAIDLKSHLITDEALTSMLVHGVYSEELVADGLEASHHFTNLDEAPPWKLVSGFNRFDDEVVSKALHAMDEQFRSREESNSGDMLHIFAMRLMMAAKNLGPAVTVEETKTECILYIDDLVSAGRLPPRGLDWRWQDEFSYSYAGFGYWVEDEYRAAFNEIAQHLVHSRELMLEGRFPQIVSELYDLMLNNSQEFMARTCECIHKTDYCYADIPIFKNVDPAEFVIEWMKSPISNWSNIRIALELRYSVRAFHESLRAERTWIEDVNEKLGKEASKRDGFARLRIENIIPQEALENLRNAIAYEERQKGNKAN